MSIIQINANILTINSYVNTSQTLFTFAIPAENIDIELNVSSNTQTFNVNAGNSNIAIYVPAVNVDVSSNTSNNSYSYNLTSIGNIFSPLIINSYFVYPSLNSSTTPPIFTPNPLLLPYASTMTDVNTHLALMSTIAALPAGGSYVDPVTGIKVYRVTDINHGGANNTGCSVQYSTQGLQIGGPWGANNNQYTIFFNNGANQGYLVDYTIGGTFSNYRTTPASPGQQAFSRVQPQIQYYGTGTHLMKYNTANNHLQNDGLFSPSGMSFVTTTSAAMWLMINLTDTWATACCSTSEVLTALNMTTGVQQNITSAGVDELYIGYTNYTYINDDSGGSGATAGYVWNLANNSVTSAGLPFGDMPVISHGASMNGFWLATDTTLGGGHMPLYSLYNNATHAQTSTTFSNNIGGTFYWGQFHNSGHWSQNSGYNQYSLYSTIYSSGGGQNQNMDQGIFFCNIASGIMYALCYNFSNSDTSNMSHTVGGSNYWAQAHASISNDGRLVIWNSNLQDTNRLDVYLAEVPGTY